MTPYITVICSSKQLFPVGRSLLARLRRFRVAAYSPTAVMAYDHAITLADDIHLIWDRKHLFNVGSCIFIASRLFLWVYGIASLLVTFWDYNTCMVRISPTQSSSRRIKVDQSLKEYSVPLLLFYASNIALWLIAAGNFGIYNG